MTALPDTDHVSRYCKPSAVDEDGLPTEQAFSLRQGEDHLSVNWLEYFGQPSLEKAVKGVRQAFREKGYQVARSGRFAVLNVRAAKEAGERGNRLLAIERMPTAEDPSHAGISGYENNNLTVRLALAQLVTFQDVHPAANSA